MTDEVVVVRSNYWHREGSNDYTNRGLDIAEIVDRAGRSHEGTWDDVATEISPGIETYIQGKQRCLRLGRAACPIRVRFREWMEYVAYDNSRNNDRWDKYYWVRYEGA